MTSRASHSVPASELHFRITPGLLLFLAHKPFSYSENSYLSGLTFGLIFPPDSGNFSWTDIAGVSQVIRVRYVPLFTMCLWTCVTCLALRIPTLL